MGDRQFRPSMVPPWTTVYLYWAFVISSVWDLGTSEGCVLVDQGLGPSAAPDPNTETMARTMTDVDIAVSPRVSSSSIPQVGRPRVLWRPQSCPVEEKSRIETAARFPVGGLEG
jgi:hypothetical protein